MRVLYIELKSWKDIQTFSMWHFQMIDLGHLTPGAIPAGDSEPLHRDQDLPQRHYDTAKGILESYCFALLVLQYIDQPDCTAVIDPGKLGVQCRDFVSRGGPILGADCPVWR
jgi:hypothetical protein